MINAQKKIQNLEGPYYLSALEIGQKKLTDKLTVYHQKKER